MAEKKSSTSRTRNFACVVYPDSAPENWQEILSELHVPAFISPLHDKDINNSSGEPKKPHYHVMIMFEGVKTKDQAFDVFEAIGGAVDRSKNHGLEVIQSQRGYARYLCHLDNPEKYQYPQEMVRQLCGADYSTTIGLVTDKYKAIGEMIDYCELNDVYSFSELLRYARSERFDWFRVLCDNGTVVVREYLKSRSWTNRGTDNA